MDDKNLFKPRTLESPKETKDFGKYTPTKAEVYNMRFWKAKKAKRKLVKPPKRMV